MPYTLKRLHSAPPGRYTTERELGRGGMAVAHLPRDDRYERRIAAMVRLPADGTVAIASELAGMLDHAHQHGVRHRSTADQRIHGVLTAIARLDRTRPLFTEVRCFGY